MAAFVIVLLCFAALIGAAIGWFIASETYHQRFLRLNEHWYKHCNTQAKTIFASWEKHMKREQEFQKSLRSVRRN
jgi:Flp pilus assembly protein TadB